MLPKASAAAQPLTFRGVPLAQPQPAFSFRRGAWPQWAAALATLAAVGGIAFVLLAGH